MKIDLKRKSIKPYRGYITGFILTALLIVIAILVSFNVYQTMPWWGWILLYTLPFLPMALHAIFVDDPTSFGGATTDILGWVIVAPIGAIFDIINFRKLIYNRKKVYEIIQEEQENKNV
jgi:hypothetical protein